MARGGRAPPVPPPFKIQICVYDFPCEFSQKVPGSLPVASKFYTKFPPRVNCPGLES